MHRVIGTVAHKYSLNCCKIFPCHISFRNKHGFSVTTPIFYCNGSPHIGHLYTALLADASKRFHQMLECGNVEFATGTDEHGTKIYQAAANNQMSPLALCDKVSLAYRETFDSYEIDYTQFVRTTDKNHINAVNNFWEELVNRGYIYRGEYSGWYCTADEAFVPETQVKEISPKEAGSTLVKVSVESNQPVEWTTEENFKFKLSSFREDLLHWLKDENVVQPKKFHNFLCSWLDQHPVLEDLSVSRPVHRVPWGIEVPGNPEQNIYVWLDALVSYLTAAGYPDPKFKEQWPPTVQILGKDILRFHGIIWPALLMAVGLEPPSKLFVHSHWQMGGDKMSKSRGNVVRPPCLSNGGTLQEVVGMRYFLLRAGTPHSDNDFSQYLMEQSADCELAGALGNLLLRCTGQAVNPEHKYPELPSSMHLIDCEKTRQLMAAVENLGDTIQPHYENCNFYLGLTYICATVNFANQFFHLMSPWKFVEGEVEIEMRLAILHLTMEALRVCGIALQPIVPSVASDLLTKLGVPVEERLWRHLNQVSWKNGPSAGGYKLSSEQKILFDRFDKGKIIKRF